MHPNPDCAAMLAFGEGPAPSKVPTVRAVGRATALAAFLLSLALHAAPLGFLAFSGLAEEPPSAGETIMEVDMVIAEAEAVSLPMSELPLQPPDPMSTMPPSTEAAQAPDRKPEEQKAEDEPEIRIPIDDPEPVTFKAEDRVISVANVAPVMTPSAEAVAAANHTYRARIARHLAKFKRFPSGMPRNVSGGQVVIRFSLNHEGRVMDAAIERASGVLILDQEALAMVRRAEPYPHALDTSVQDLTFSVPVSYRLRM